MRFVKAFVSVHRWRLALALLALSLFGMVLLGDREIARLGLNLLVRSISPALLLSTVSSVAAVVALSGTEMLSLANHPRKVCSQFAWYVVVLALTLAAVLPTVWFGGFANVSMAAVARNVSVFMAIGTWALLVRRVELCWIVPMLLPFISAQFGGSSDGFSYAWWAVTIDPETTSVQLFAATTLALISAVLYAFSPFPRKPCQ